MASRSWLPGDSAVAVSGRSSMLGSGRRGGMLSAGLDSFALRRPDLLGSLTVFEVDHPASQAWKLERVREFGLPLSDSQKSRRSSPYDEVAP